MTLLFECPPPKRFSSRPKWDGVNFVYGNQRTPVLEYSENFAGWSDEMTALHEEVAGKTHPMDVASRRDALRQIRRLLPSSRAVILEIGCSSGFLLSEIVAAFPDATVMGADVVKEPLFHLAEKMPGVPLFRFDLLQNPLPDRIVDMIVMLNVLEHIEDDVSALKKAFGLLKPGGSLVLEVPAGPGLYDNYDSELHHFRRYSATELRRKLRLAGFEVLRSSHLGMFIFPAFAFSKLKDRYFPPRTDTSGVRKRILATSDNGMVKRAMEIESRYLGGVPLPFGIRVLVAARRPGQ